MERPFLTILGVFFMIALAQPTNAATYQVSSDTITPPTIEIINQTEIDQGIVWSWVQNSDGTYNVTGQFTPTMWSEIQAIDAANGGQKNTLIDAFILRYNLSATRTTLLSQFADLVNYPLVDNETVKHSLKLVNRTTGTIKFVVDLGTVPGVTFKWGFNSTYGRVATYRPPTTWSTLQGIGWGQEGNATTNDAVYTGTRGEGNSSNFSGYNRSVDSETNTIISIGVTIDGKMSSATGTNVFRVSITNGSHWSCAQATGDINTADVTTNIAGCTDATWGLTFNNITQVGANVSCGSTGGRNCQLDFFAMNFTFLQDVELIVYSNVTTTAISQNKTFTINANVTGTGDSNSQFGIINFYPRFNLSSTSPDTIVNTTNESTPFSTNPEYSNLSRWIVGQTQDLSARGEIAMRDASFDANGSRFYTVGTTTDTIIQYNLSSPYFITGATYSNNISIVGCDGNVHVMRWKPDGTIFILGGRNGKVCQYNLTTAWDLNTATNVQNASINTSLYDNTQQAGDMSNDGTRFVLVGSANDFAHRWDLTTPWNVSEMTYKGNKSVIGSLPRGITLSQDGRVMYITESSSPRLAIYTMDQPYNISNSTFIYSETQPKLNGTVPFGLKFAKDYSILTIVADDVDDIILHYTNFLNLPSQYCIMPQGGSTCSANWTINYTGPLGGNYTFDVFTQGLNTTYNLTTGNSTADVNIYNATESSEACSYPEYLHRYRFENNGNDAAYRLNLTGNSSVKYNTTGALQGNYSLALAGYARLSNIGNHSLYPGNNNFSITYWAMHNKTFLDTYYGGVGNYSSTGTMAFFSSDSATQVSYLSIANDLAFTINSRNLNQWYHYAWVYRNNKTVELYINGTLVGSKALANNMNLNSSLVYIGQSHTGFSGLGGLMDDWSIFNYSLTAEQVTTIYTSNCNTTDPSTGASCTYTGSGNWEVTCSDSCTINGSTDVLGNNVTFSGAGTVLVTGNITNATKVQSLATCQVYTRNGGRIARR